MAKENINVAIFTALKVSEISKVPILLMSNPGVGKSTSVELFAAVRGYHLQLLRGNSTSETEILGYDVADTNRDSETTKHLRPSWYTEILEMKEKGIPTLLFLDEITTANDFVQAALLHLVFERKVGSEKLPDDTLIVSAGNYAQNLSNNMNMLPPLMNRFLLFNIIPEVSDLEIFLSKYKGAIANPEGAIMDKREELLKMMKKLDAQEESFGSDTIKNRVGEHIERCIIEVTKMLWSREKLIDLSEKDLKDIYSDDTEKKLYGFVTFRTLNYLRDVTVAMFQCFGKAGLTSDNYRNMIDGLCGIGVTKDSKGNVKTSLIGKNYFDNMRNTVNEIEKMKNNSLPQYERYFFDIMADIKKRNTKKLIFEKPEMQGIINKIDEFKNDKSVQNIERPIDYALIKEICTALRDSAANVSDIKVTSSGGSADILKSIDASTMAGKIEYWNMVIDIYKIFDSLTSDSKLNYDQKTKESVSGIKEELRRFAFCLMSVRKVLCNKDASLEKLIPTMKTIGAAV